jgi:hypothetical protein
MTEPIYSETTERLWEEQIPGVYRFEDARNDWTMKKYVGSFGDVLSEVDVLVDRIKYVPPEDDPGPTDLYSDLVDPWQADAEWLPWLAQLVGVKFRAGLAVSDQRTQIATAIGGVRAGTPQAIAQVVQTILTGTKTVYIYPRSNLGGIDAGSQWEVLILTLSEETTADVVATVIAAGAKPAGIKLYHDNYGASWNTQEAAYTTWTAWEKPWQDIERGV